MFGHTFEFDLTRKYIVLFGTLFNSIYIRRSDDDGRLAQLIRVPLTYAPKEKMLARLAQDPELDRETAINLPRMSFELSNMYYDATRKLNSIGKVVRKNDNNPNKLKYQYQPVPFNLNFTLHVYIKNAHDGTKIVEQILPFFTPHWNATVNLIPEMNITRDIPIHLVSVQYEDIYEGDYITRRSIVWTLDFIMKAEYWGPVVSSPIIKFANTNFMFGDKSQPSEPVSILEVRPGLTANGEPTSNAAASIPAVQIEVDDDWGFIEEFSGQIILE